MKTLVLFGSESDKAIYQELNSFLENHFEVDFEVISAHRNPARLKERLAQDDFDCVFAGAGLAAHLPGVCASLTLRPVFGIPVGANLQGLDASLSIQQMPFGVPVGAMSATNWKTIPAIIERVKKASKINLVYNKDIENNDYGRKELERTKTYLEQENITYTMNTETAGALNIHLVTNATEIKETTAAFHVPLFDNDRKNSAKAALELFDWTMKGGVWFGVNNTRNAIKFFQRFK